MHIIIHVPDVIEPYGRFLKDFLEVMVRKLVKNAHKKTPTIKTLPEIMSLLQQEIVEFEEQVNEDKFNENSLVELADQANFSFLAYVALRMQGVEHGPK